MESFTRDGFRKKVNMRGMGETEAECENLKRATKKNKWTSTISLLSVSKLLDIKSDIKHRNLSFLSRCLSS